MENNWMELDQQYILPTYGRMPVVVDKAEGMYITDVQGKTYLDLFSGLAVNILGHCHDELNQEMVEQSQRFSHISNFFYNQPAIRLAEKIVKNTFDGKIFFTNSGAESTEAGVKYIHKYGVDQGLKGIVVFKNSFHGRTLGALQLTRMASIQQDFPTVDFPVYELEDENIQELEKMIIDHKPSALLFEPISGSGGIKVISKEFMEKAAELCHANGVLYCVDEIQTGMGRTGKLFAYQHTNVKPDILLFAKGVGGGLPLGGMLVREGISHYFKPGDHGTTFAPSPISASLGRRTLEILEDGLLTEVATKEAYLLNKIEGIRKQFPEFIGEIRGKGMMLGIEVLKNHTVLRNQFMEKNILVNVTNGNILRLLPSLIIEEKHIDEFANAFMEILRQW
ncbi:aspartate aminotransferase family protein [Alkaliphilus hydrothermalis]|uniref:Acetylornithine aminotransferase n=1 Tax=Alkaliphilus hydrothermalis TaxID=1482730 RepID=A0ABS2NPY5_9FIRM|nr:acetylornithine transaminase [Alkaliphilus hydrothermalis]MBM7614897.1 acetylornithine aminotransferase [Alkaliphilus hydrothermalis]